MRSISAKVILAFCVVCLVQAALVAVLIRESTRRSFEHYLREDAIQVFITDVTRHFENTGSWEDLHSSLISRNRRQSNPHRGLNNGPPPLRQSGSRRHPPIHNPRFGLADPAGNVLISNGEHYPGEIVSQAVLNQGVLFEVDGSTQAVVLLPSESLPPSPQALDFLQNTDLALYVALIGALIIALLIGIWFAQTYTRPILQLTHATQAVAHGQPQPPLPVRTNDELGLLTGAFNNMAAEVAMAKSTRRQMTADIAHELNTPLTVIRGYLEAMRDGDLSPNEQRLEAMLLEATHLQRLIEDVRLLSLADAGELPLSKENVQIHELLERVKTTFTQKAEAKDITIELAIEEKLPAINLDTGRIFQVLSNLVQNALRYTSTKGIIILAARQRGDKITLKVRDTGQGIPPDVLPHIFERFYKADKSRQAHLETTGLGLAIAKSIVDAHGGSISVESEPGTGTVFSIELPVFA